MISTLAGLALGAGAPSALAADAPVDLAWEAPAGCPERAAVAAEIERLGAGRGGNRRPVRASATVTRKPAGFGLRVSTEADGVTRERSLDAATCGELAEAAALIIAIAAGDAGPGPTRPARDAASPEAATPPPAAARGAAPGDEAPRAPARSEPGGVAFRVRASGLLDVAALPQPAMGVELGAAASLGRVRVELSGADFPPATATVPGTDAGVEVGLLTADLRLCYAPIRGPFEASACLAGEAGAFLVRGFGVRSRIDTASPWLASGIGLSATYLVTPYLAVAGGVDGFALHARPRFGDVYEPPPATARARLGLELRLPSRNRAPGSTQQP